MQLLPLLCIAFGIDTEGQGDRLVIVGDLRIS